MLALTIILTILVLLALAPVGAEIQFREKVLKVKAFLGPLQIQILPAKPKKPKKPKKPRQSKPARASKKAAKPKRAWTKRELIALFREFLPVLLDVLSSLHRKLVLEDVVLRGEFGGTDPAKLAINYGRAWAAIGTLSAVLENCFTIRHRDFQAVIGNTDAAIGVEALLRLRLRIGQVFFVSFRCGIKLLRIFLRMKRMQKAAGQAAAAG